MSAALKDSWNAFVALIWLVTWPIRWVYKRMKVILKQILIGTIELPTKPPTHMLQILKRYIDFDRTKNLNVDYKVREELLMEIPIATKNGWHDEEDIKSKITWLLDNVRFNYCPLIKTSSSRIKLLSLKDAMEYVNYPVKKTEFSEFANTFYFDIRTPVSQAKNQAIAYLHDNYD